MLVAAPTIGAVFPNIATIPLRNKEMETPKIPLENAFPYSFFSFSLTFV